VTGRDVLAGGGDVPALVVEVEVGLEGLEELALVQASASSTAMFQSMSVRTARSCAGALRAVTSAVRTRIGTSVPDAACSRCRASSRGLNGPGGNGFNARAVSWRVNASRPSR
jgi:hypothetical protein